MTRLLSFFVNTALILSISGTACGEPVKSMIYGIVTPALVTVTAGNRQGSGFFVSADGFLVTNQHVVRGSSNATIRDSSGTDYVGRVTALDDERDLAIIKLDVSASPLLRLARPRGDRAGDRVFIFGSPLGLDNSMIAGTIMNSNAVVDERPFIQIHGYVEPGNSGGPVVDSFGTVIGVSTTKLSRGEAILLAVPVDEVIEMLEDNGVCFSTLEITLDPAVGKAREADPPKTNRTAFWLLTVLSMLLIVGTTCYVVFVRIKRNQPKDFNIIIHGEDQG